VRGMSAAAAGRMTSRETHILLFGGDWACAHGDPAGLAYVAHQLERHVVASRSLQLQSLATLCLVDYARACELWPPLRHALVAELAE